jgi:glycolate oxidase FAD binding subunit
MSGIPSIAGVVATRQHAPANRAELVALLRDLAAQRATFACVGGGTQLDYGNAPRALDAVVRTTALDRVVDYAPEDQTITVEAGMRFAELDALLAQYDQVLPLDVGDRHNATIGGAIATNAFGAQRHRYGSIKDLIVGIEIVRPDGVAARSGGKVVKNVAGFDLPKLMVGALGTLGAIATASFRVFPKPAAMRAMLVRTTPASALFAACLADRSLEPVAIAAYAQLGGIVFTFAGLAAAVAHQLAHLAALAAQHACTVDELDRAALARCADAECAVRTAGAWRWTTATDAVSARVAQPAERIAQTTVSYPTLGVTLAAAEDGAAMDDVVARRCSGIVFRAMPLHARGVVDAWGAPPPAFALMRAIKANFDPDGRCNPGRFVGGL